MLFNFVDIKEVVYLFVYMKVINNADGKIIRSSCFIKKKKKKNKRFFSAGEDLQKGIKVEVIKMTLKMAQDLIQTNLLKILALICNFTNTVYRTKPPFYALKGSDKICPISYPLTAQKSRAEH